MKAKQLNRLLYKDFPELWAVHQDWEHHEKIEVSVRLVGKQAQEYGFSDLVYIQDHCHPEIWIKSSNGNLTRMIKVKPRQGYNLINDLVLAVGIPTWSLDLIFMKEVFRTPEEPQIAINIFRPQKGKDFLKIFKC